MAENKATNESVDLYIAALVNPQQAVDCRALMTLFLNLTNQVPKNFSVHGSIDTAFSMFCRCFSFSG